MAFERGDRVREIPTGKVGSVTGLGGADGFPVALFDGAKFSEPADPQFLAEEA